MEEQEFVEEFSEVLNIELDTNDIQGIKVDKEAFQDGVSSMSALAGQFSCLVNCGMSIDQAFSIVYAIYNDNIQDIIQ